MGTWFLSGSIDVVAEREAALQRDRFACGILFSRLADALIEPDETLKEDAIAAAPHLGFRRSNNEAMVYRLIGYPKKPQVLIFGEIVNAFAMGALISEAQRRDAL